MNFEWDPKNELSSALDAINGERGATATMPKDTTKSNEPTNRTMHRAQTGEHAQNKRTQKIIAACAVAAVVMGVFAGSRGSDASSESVFNDQITNPGKILPTLAPGAEPNGTGSVEVEGLDVQDYTLHAYKPGAINSGCKEIGSYGINESVLPVMVRGHEREVTIKKTPIHLYACGNNVRAAVQNTGINSENTVEKQVLVNQESFDYGTRFSKNPFTSVASVLPAEQLASKGYDVCDAYKDMLGCDAAQIPEGYLLSKKEATAIKASAAILALRALQAACAPVAFKALQATTENFYDQQVKDANLVSTKFVFSNGESGEFVPDYTGSAIQQLVKAGGTNDTEKLQKLFGKEPLLSPPTCTPNNKVKE